MALCWRQPSAVQGVPTGVTIPQPPGMRDGDVLVALCFANQTGTLAFTGSSDWTHWRDVPVAFGGAILMLSVFSKLAGGELPVWTFSTSCTSCFGAVIAVFDDGGAPVDIDLVTTSAAVVTGSYAAPSMTPNGSVDPWELVIGCWGSGGAIGLPTIGAPLFSGVAGAATVVAGAYPIQAGAAISPSATGGGTCWLAAQVAIKNLAVSGTRKMVRGVSAKLSSTIPVPANVANGDLMVLFAHSAGSALGAVAGWTQIAITADNLYAVYQRSALSEPGSYTVTNAARGIIACFFDIDGGSISTDLFQLGTPGAQLGTSAAELGSLGAAGLPNITYPTVNALNSGSSLLFPSPAIVTSFNNAIVLSHFAASSGRMVGPYGPTDAGGVHLDYATQSETTNILSWAMQPVAGLSAVRTAYSGTSGPWYSSQVGVLGQGLPVNVGPDLFPELPGISWSLVRKPEGGLTVIQKSQSGKESRWSLRPPGRPIWTLTLTYEVLRANRGVATPMTGRYLNMARVPNLSTLFNVDTLTENEFAILAGFFNRQAGSGLTWFFDDMNDNTAGLYQFGRGDGKQTSWQTNFTTAWQTQFPSAPLLFTDYSPSGIRLPNTFSALKGTISSTGLITPTQTPQVGQPLYITAPSSSYFGTPLLGEQFGTGDGTSTSFQLVRWMGELRDGIAEPMQNLNGLPVIWVGGIQSTPTINANGIVTFASPPARNAVLSWAGKFYVACRFLSDNADIFEEFAYSLYAAQKIDLISVLR